MQERSNLTIAALLFFLAFTIAKPPSLIAQLPDPSALTPSTAPNPLSDTTVNPGKVLLFDLEARFAKDVLARGAAPPTGSPKTVSPSTTASNPPSAAWQLLNSQPTWHYQLTWTRPGSGLSPSGDMSATPGATTKATAKTPTATPSPPPAATSLSGANNPMVPGKSSSTPAPTSPPPPATAANSPNNFGVPVSIETLGPKMLGPRNAGCPTLTAVLRG